MHVLSFVEMLRWIPTKKKILSVFILAKHKFAFKDFMGWLVALLGVYTFSYISQTTIHLFSSNLILLLYNDYFIMVFVSILCRICCVLEIVYWDPWPLIYILDILGPGKNGSNLQMGVLSDRSFSKHLMF